MNRQKHNFTKLWAPHRRRIYWSCLIFGALVTFIPMIGVLLGFFPPTSTYWVWGVLIYIPLLLPLATAWWDAPGENRTTLEKAYEFILVWFPVTASSQITWETPWLVCDALGLMHGVGPQDRWAWLWWGYGAADIRYLISDPSLFAMEVVAILGGLILLRSWVRLLKAKGDEGKIIRPLFHAFFSSSMMLAVVTIYFLSEARAGFVHIKEGFWGFAYKFVFMNIWWLIVPLIALPFTIRIIDYLYWSTLTNNAGQRSRG